MGVVEVDKSGAVCRIRLNRPNKLNALNDEVRRALHAAFDELADDLSVRAVVLSGNGRCFSAGADLDTSITAGSSTAGTWARRRHAGGGWQRLLERLESLPQVTVAALHSHCIGGAALLAAACDLRIAADDLSVSIPEVAIGIPLTWAGVPRLVREVGVSMARDMVMTGRRIDAPTALACGFVTRVCRAEALPGAIDDVVATLLGMPDAPLAMTKSMFAAISRDALGTTGWADADLVMWSLREAEAGEAAAAYAARRLRSGREST